MVTIDCKSPGCTCVIAQAARVEVLVHVDAGQSYCAHHGDAAADLPIAPFPCPIPMQRKAMD